MATKGLGQNINFNISFFNKVTAKDKAFLARQLSTMISAGLPLNKAIEILDKQESNHKLKEVLGKVREDLEAGAPFSAAVAKYPEVFDRIFVNIVVSGESVGQLAEVLLQLADQYDKDSSFSGKVKGAFAYPAFIFVAMIIVGAIMMVYIVPQLTSIFEEAEAKLPLPTRVIIALSLFLQQYWWAAIIGVVVAIILGRAYLKSAAGQRFYDLIQLKLPQNLGTEIFLTRLTRTLGMLIKAGTPILEALRITSGAVNNIFYEEALNEAAEEVKRGVPLSRPITSDPNLFPPIVSQMTSVGEQTGQLDKILLNLADYYEDQVDTKLKTLSSLIEPIIIVIIGVGVGFLVYSILIPIYNIAQI
ncbi:type II secretion system F family protein [Candidatus Berkelbacteria bacterium]|nr:type II secretion system F family protein [Candidatus Berkelbacteria bacterium]